MNAPVFLKLTLPWPPPVNSCYKPVVIGGRPRIAATSELKDWKARVAHQLRNTPTIIGAVEVTWWLYRPRRAGDYDGPLKPLGDALNFLAWIDDDQVDDAHIHRRVDSGNPRVEVEIQGERWATREEVTAAKAKKLGSLDKAKRTRADNERAKRGGHFDAARVQPDSSPPPATTLPREGAGILLATPGRQAVATPAFYGRGGR